MECDERKKLRRVLFGIGLVLVCSFIYSIFNIMSSVKGYETADAICAFEDMYYVEQTAVYNRKYLYYVSGKEYELNDISVEKKPCQVIKYNPNNPDEARAYDGVTNTDGVVLFFIGLLLMFGPNLLKIDAIRIKLDELKDKFLRISKRYMPQVVRISKRNMLNFVRICFWCSIMYSLSLSVREMLLETNWNEALLQYTKLEIIMECIFFIIQRCNIE